jgi:predicted esterase
MPALRLRPLAGLSTYMPLRKEPPLISEANQKTPVFQAHGDMDYTVGKDLRAAH